MHYFWNVEKCILKMSKNWSFVLCSFCIWFYVFTPGSHCFAIDKLNRSAICTVHFRSIWTAPLWFSTCRSWAGSKVTAAKLGPKKSEFHLPNWIFKCFSFTFFQVHFQNAFVHIFASAFSKRILFALFSHFFEKCEKMRFENAHENIWKMCWNVKNMWKCEKMEQRAVEKFLFLSTMFPIFSSYRFFSGFLWKPMLIYRILNLNILLGM